MNLFVNLSPGFRSLVSVVLLGTIQPTIKFVDLNVLKNLENRFNSENSYGS